MNVNNVRMESVDVITDVLIDCPVATVSAFASDPGNAMEWYANIKSMQWKTPKPMAIGSRIAFVARFLGKKLEYTYEIAEFIPGERFVMRTADGLFPMETTYAREKVAERQTRMTLRNRGTPSGFSKIFAPVMAFAMRRENKKDLTRLKADTGAELLAVGRVRKSPRIYSDPALTLNRFSNCLPGSPWQPGLTASLPLREQSQVLRILTTKKYRR